MLDEVYIKQKKWQQHPEVPLMATQFRINTEIETVLSATSGPGWKAILDGNWEVSRNYSTLNFNYQLSEILVATPSHAIRKFIWFYFAKKLSVKLTTLPNI